MSKFKEFHGASKCSSSLEGMYHPLGFWLPPPKNITPVLQSQLNPITLAPLAHVITNVARTVVKPGSIVMHSIVLVVKAKSRSNMFQQTLGDHCFQLYLKHSWAGHVESLVSQLHLQGHWRNMAHIFLFWNFLSPFECAGLTDARALFGTCIILRFQCFCYVGHFNGKTNYCNHFLDIDLKVASFTFFNVEVV